ncbi:MULTISPECIES: lytic transglycosylase domain-containing protein [Actinomadura]|uniref:Lytic transglycosylase domain-containing protein n=1 Tax=Actinomadura geliboluensis TaxID=882440 RepID=A0A5S4H9L0_9ACTN|nr:lytic transglycosylase domain-containing protein [Actinomadura geliboluensis]TMR41935.1 lytic transglycosylase domain-containing protein [Actinomadura geliboluensis]
MASPPASRTGAVPGSSGDGGGDGEAPAARPPSPRPDAARSRPEKKRRDPRGGARSRKARRSLPFLIGGIAVLAIASTSGGVYAALTADKAEPAAAGTPQEPPPSVPPSASGDPVNVATGGQVAPLRRVVPPDVLAVGAGSIPAAKIKRIAGLSRVKDVTAVAGGAVQLQGRQVNAFAVDPSSFRSWTPPATAKKTELWEALAGGKFVVSTAAAEQLQLTRGYQYPVVGRTMPNLTMGGSGPLGLPGIDLLVGKKSGGEMGLVPNVAILVNAPGVDPAKVVRAVTRVLGPGTNVLNLHESKYQSSTGGGRSSSYLDLYKQAATTCPGLSWTVLAAIGQVESDHGRNAGRSSAGALGPMQFMPATWKAYGVDGDGDGKADIMNPYDAIPGAAKYLCANGAGRGGKQLYRAVWHYNHADWYVQKVLNLARAYAARYD